MSQAKLITRLVVGEPRPVSLGKPVRQRQGDTSGTALRWSNGRWQAPSPGLLVRLSELVFGLGRKNSKAIVVRTGANAGLGRKAGSAAAALTTGSTAQSARRSFPLAPWTLGLGAVVLVATGALVIVAQSTAPQAPPPAVPPSAVAGLPIPHAGGGQQVKVLDSNYEEAAASEARSGEAAAVASAAGGQAAALPGPLPIAALAPQAPVSRPPASLPVAPPATVASPAAKPQAVVPAAPAVSPATPPKVQPAPPAVATAAPAAKPASAITAASAPMPRAAASSSDQAAPAVVFDADTHTARQPNSVSSAQAAPAPTGAPRAVAPASTMAVARPVQPAAEPSPPRAAAAPAAGKAAAGLIAITPDGKMAVFTNPSTKLPQPFKVGDQLATGETIRSIDAKDGKVITSSKEYSLD